ncbi:MAG: hypothetical protein LAO30_22380 [Acidobacteriia bacterium]|nr:hypothetical protein [Terriglobia bacterium]
MDGATPPRVELVNQSGADARSPSGGTKEASCVSRTPFKGGTRAGRRLATEETTSTLAIKK